MRFLLLAFALLGFPLLACASSFDTPITIEFTAVPKKDSNCDPTSASTGEVLMIDPVVLPFMSPTNESCKLTFSIDDTMGNGITPMHITLNQSGTAGAEIFNAAMPYVTNKLITIMDTQFYTLQVKITPSEQPKRAVSGK